MNDVEKAVYDTITPLIADHDNTYEGCKDIVRAAVKAAIAALADELDEDALLAAAEAHAKQQDIETKYVNIGKIATVIRAYLTVLKDSK